MNFVFFIVIRFLTRCCRFLFKVMAVYWIEPSLHRRQPRSGRVLFNVLFWQWHETRT